MRVGREVVNGAVVVSPHGEIDISTVSLLNRQLAAANDAPATQPIVVDLAGVSFMDSTGLRALLDAADRAREGGRPFVVFQVPLAVARVLEVTKLEERFPAIPDLETATIGSLSASS